MRLASNKLKDILGFYYTELAPLYDRAEIEALLRLILEHYLGYTHSDILIKSEENLNQSDLLKLYDCAKALKKNIPLQYILGEAWFYNLKFWVNPHVLIPRPETEELVELILDQNKAITSFLDIGTGSGCIPVSLKKHLPDTHAHACDISVPALDVARLNASRLQSPVRFFEADVLDTASFLRSIYMPFEVIVSNPPYIMPSEKKIMSPHVIGQEPDLALFVEGSDPIVFYKKIVDACGFALQTKGRLYFELNPITAGEVMAYSLASDLFEKVEVIDDLSGKARFFIGIRK